METPELTKNPEPKRMSLRTISQSSLAALGYSKSQANNERQ